VCRVPTKLTEEMGTQRQHRPHGGEQWRNSSVACQRGAQIVNSIETLLDFEQLTVKDVTRWLKAVEDRKQAPDPKQGAVEGKLESPVLVINDTKLLMPCV